MLDWKGASEEEQRLEFALKLIFRNHSKLLVFMFKSDVPRLKDTPKRILKKMKPFSSGEKVLIQVALDLWDSSGNAMFLDIIHLVDRESQRNLFAGLQYLKIIPPVGALEPSTIKNGRLFSLTKYYTNTNTDMGSG